MAKSAAEVQEAALQVFLSGDMDELRKHLTDDVKLHVPGTNKLSGDYNGQDSFINDFVGTLMSLTAGDFRLEPHAILGKDEHAIGLYNITAGRDGKKFSWQHVNVYHVRDEKIAEVFQHPGNVVEWNEFWS